MMDMTEIETKWHLPQAIKTGLTHCLVRTCIAFRMYTTAALFSTYTETLPAGQLRVCSPGLQDSRAPDVFET